MIESVFVLVLVFRKLQIKHGKLDVDDEAVLILFHFDGKVLRPIVGVLHPSSLLGDRGSLLIELGVLAGGDLRGNRAVKSSTEIHLIQPSG